MGMNQKKCLVLLIGMLLVSQVGGQESVRGLPTIDFYDGGGLAGSNNFKDIARGPDGTMYFANNRQILVYDGTHWTAIETPNHCNIHSLAVGADGKIYWGCDGNAGFITGDSLDGRPLLHSLRGIEEWSEKATRPVADIFSWDSRLFFRSQDASFSLLGDSVEIFLQDYRAAFIDEDKVIAMVSEKGLGQITENGQFNLLPGGEFFGAKTVADAVRLGRGEYLIANRLGTLYRYSEGRTTEFAPEWNDVFREADLYDLELLSNGEVAIATLNNGIFIFDSHGQIVYHFGSDLFNGLSDIFRIRQFGDGNLWVGAQGGIFRIEYPSAFTLFDQRNGMTKGAKEVFEFGGDIYAGTYAGLCRLEKDKTDQASVFRPVGGIDDTYWGHLSIDGRLLVGFGNLGVHELRKDKLIKIGPDLQPSGFVRSKCDPQRVYVPHANGLGSFYLDDGIWRWEGNLQGITGDYYTLVELDNCDLLLSKYQNYFHHISFDEEVHDLENYTETRIDSSHGHPHDDLFDFILQNGKVVLSGWESKSMYSYDQVRKEISYDSTFKNMLGFQEEVYVHPGQSLEDDFWFSTYADPGDLSGATTYLAKLDGKGRASADLVDRSRFADGLGPVEFVIDSMAWLTWSNSPLYLHDFKEIQRSEAGAVRISQIDYARDSLISAGFREIAEPSFPFRKNHLRFTWSLTEFIKDYAPKYKVQLLGYDDGWSDWISETRYEYENLPPGHFTFQVVGQDVYRNVTQPSTFSFTILPPWYRTWWAYLLYLAGAVAAISMIVRWRSHQLRKEKMALQDVVESRTADLQLSNEKLEAQKRKLQEQASQLHELDQVKSRLFANISHEFRTPLTLIKGPIDELKHSPRSKLAPAHVDMISRNTDRLLRLVNQLLDLAKLDSGDLPVNLSEGDAYQVIRLTAASFSSLAAQRNMDYQIKIPNIKFWASFDRDHLEKITLNLLSNAFKFSPGKGSVLIAVDFQDGALGIEVQDSGVGIPTRDLGKVFDRFYQVDESETRAEGSGLGLALIKELVEHHNGKILVDSTLGHGSRFTVHLPMQQILAPPTPKEKLIDHIENVMSFKPVTLESSPEDLENPSLLVIEDNVDMQQYIFDLLKNDFQIQVADNGSLGLEEAIRVIPDLIISDVMMPGLDGMKLCELLKSDERTSHIPIIMLTAKAGLENKLAGLDIGADVYLTKPFEARELKAQSINLLEQRKRMREKFSKLDDFQPKDIEWSSPDQRFLTRLIEVLESNYDDSEFGLPEMIEKLAMSKTQLNRKMRALTNHSSGQFLRNFRLKRAAQIIEQGENVTQVAYAVGFSNLSYFAKCFKEMFDQTPSEYAKKSNP